VSVLHYEPFRDPFRELDRLSSQLFGRTAANQAMPMDVYRTDEGYHVDLDLPGLEPDAIEVTAVRGAVTVRATRSPGYGEKSEVLVAERPHGSFSRQLTISDELDADNLSAEYVNGVLRVLIPVSPTTQPRRIQISGGGDAPRTITQGDGGRESSG